MSRRNSQAIASQLVKSSIFLVATLAVLALVAVQLGLNVDFGNTKKYSALFADTSGLKSGDTVRVAGVEIGRVQSVTVKASKIGVVDFSVDADRPVPSNVQVAIRWLNLQGDRYLELRPGAGPAPALPVGATIPETQTKPALDLDVLLAGFNPLLQGLDAQQINDVSSNLISVLQGEGGNLDSLFAHAASLTGTLADQDKVIGQVIDNFNTVLGTLDQRSPQLGATISQLQKLTSGLNSDRDRLGGSFDSANRLVSSVNDLLSKVRGPLKGTIDQVARVTKQANAGQQEINTALGELPGGYLRVSRLGSRGSTYNVFICSLQLRLTGADGKPFYTPWFGPSPGIQRCKPGDVNPTETPAQRVQKEQAGQSDQQVQNQWARANNSAQNLSQGGGGR